jgi:hypothetical protein
MSEDVWAIPPVSEDVKDISLHDCAPPDYDAANDVNNQFSEINEATIETCAQLRRLLTAKTNECDSLKNQNKRLIANFAAQTNKYDQLADAMMRQKARCTFALMDVKRKQLDIVRLHREIISLKKIERSDCEDPFAKSDTPVGVSAKTPNEYSDTLELHVADVDLDVP